MSHDGPTIADLWARPEESSVSEEEYYLRWEIVRLIREAGEGRVISREEVRAWRPRPEHVITLEEIVDASWHARLPCAPGEALPSACGG